MDASEILKHETTFSERKTSTGNPWSEKPPASHHGNCWRLIEWSRKKRQNSGETFIWSGRQDNKHQEGIALIFASKNANTQLQSKSISERLLFIRLIAVHVKLFIIVAFAPIENSDEEDKDDFYYSLHMSIGDVPRHYVLYCLETLVQV